MTVVTQQSLHDLVSRGDEVAMHAIGRALVHLFNRQTEHERQVNTVRVHNTIGFTPADGKSGCISAKFYLKHGRLEDWQVERWAKPNVKGVARIAKYHRQLNEEAEKRSKAPKSHILETHAKAHGIPIVNVPLIKAEPDDFNARWAGYKDEYARRELEQEAAAHLKKR